ncbi:histidine kinase [Calothrix brevissima NIES-22]|nr:histidine kinase [Calothrix brevissima NIES-22]
MNDSLAQDLSIYQLALSMQAPPSPLPLSPATVLSILRSQIDLLIERQIVATLWVKLPPGKIWQAELWRYQSAIDKSVNKSVTIYDCQLNERRKHEPRGTDFQPSPDKSVIKLFPTRYLQREYFFIALSPEFSSLILAHRPLKRRKTQTLRRGNRKTPPLVVMTTVEGRIIQRVLDGIKQVVTPEFAATIVASDVICPDIPEAILVNQLLIKQVQRQNEIDRQLMTKRIAKLQQQNQKLTNKAQTKDEYLSNACQELRTPLTHMKTALSLLNSPTLKPPQRQRYLQMLNNQCDRQNSLISGLLDLIHLDRNLQESPLEAVSLGDLVPGIVSTYQPVAQEKGIMLAYTIPTNLPSVWCINGGLKLIAINLLHNSIKFTPNGGQVWVRSRVNGDYVQLEVRDTGIGIAEAEIPKIFDSFYRVRSGTTDESSGPGLGLTVTQQLILRCGGFITVRSKPNEGTTFIVNLPRVRDR